MEYIVNSKNDDYQVILFQHDGRNWEIILDNDIKEFLIELSIMKRMDELDEEFKENNTYDNSDLIVDYTTKKEI